MGENEVGKTGKDPPDGDPDGGQGKKDNEEMMVKKSEETTEKYNHIVRISIKEKQGEDTKYLQMMFQLLRECTKHDDKTTMSDHGGNMFNVDKFPLKEEDFKKAFDGGPQDENGYQTPGSYYENIGGGRSFVTWCGIHTTLKLSVVTENIKVWSDQNKIFISPISTNYKGPRETIGHIFGLNVKNTFRKNIVSGIQEIIDTSENTEIKEKEENIWNSCNVELIKTKYYLRNKKLCSTYVYSVIVPKGYAKHASDAMTEAYTNQKHKKFKGEFIATGISDDTNKNFIENLILKQNKINNHKGMEIFNLTKKMLDAPIQIKNGQETTTTTIRTEISKEETISSIEETTTTDKTGRHLLIHDDKYPGRARAMFDKIKKWSEQLSNETKIDNKTP